jgi:hypothetical protein
MINALTNSQISLLCEIGEFNLDKASEEQRSDLALLLSEGFVEHAKADAAASFALSLKGEEFLCERGAGLNEA